MSSTSCTAFSSELSASGAIRNRWCIGCGLAFFVGDDCATPILAHLLEQVFMLLLCAPQIDGLTRIVLGDDAERFLPAIQITAALAPLCDTRIFAKSS